MRKLVVGAVFLILLYVSVPINNLVHADYCGPDPNKPIVVRQVWTCDEKQDAFTGKWTCVDNQGGRTIETECNKTSCSENIYDHKCGSSGRCVLTTRTVYCYVLGNPPGSTNAPQPTDAPPAPTEAPVCPVPDAPANLRPVGTLSSCISGPTNITLSWDLVADVNQYPLYFNDQSNPWNGCGSGNSGDFCNDTNSSTTYTVTVQPGRAYDFSVSAVNSCGTWAAQGTNVTFSVPACAVATSTPVPTATATPQPSCGSPIHFCGKISDGFAAQYTKCGTTWNFDYSIPCQRCTTGSYEACNPQVENCTKRNILSFPEWCNPTPTPLPPTPTPIFCNNPPI